MCSEVTVNSLVANKIVAIGELKDATFSEREEGRRDGVGVQVERSVGFVRFHRTDGHRVLRIRRQI